MKNATILLLKKCGVPPHLLGYHYVGEAVEMIKEDSSVLHAITKVLYPSIAKKFDSTPTRVERAIRHAVQTAVKNLAQDEILAIFGNTLHYGERPSNSHFIAALVELAKCNSGN